MCHFNSVCLDAFFLSMEREASSFKIYVKSLLCPGPPHQQVHFTLLFCVLEDGSVLYWIVCMSAVSTVKASQPENEPFNLFIPRTSVRAWNAGSARQLLVGTSSPGNIRHVLNVYYTWHVVPGTESETALEGWEHQASNQDTALSITV